MKKLLAVVPLLVGCAPALSTFQPAHVAKKGHVQAGAGMDVNIPTGSIIQGIDAAKDLARAAENRALTDEEALKVFDAGVTMAVNPPAIVPHAGAAYVPWDRTEIGLRWVSGGFRLGARYQFLTKDITGIDLTLGFGVTRFTYEFPVSDQIPWVEVDDFSRWQFDFPLLLGTSGDWYRWWAGPKLMFSTFKTAMRIDAPKYQTEIANFKGTGGYFGAQGGIALGYKYLFVAFELTFAQMFGHADTTFLGASHRSEVDGFIVYPAFGLIGEF
jgi:hypothetical protein